MQPLKKIVGKITHFLIPDIANWDRVLRKA